MPKKSSKRKTYKRKKKSKKIHKKKGGGFDDYIEPYLQKNSPDLLSKLNNNSFFTEYYIKTINAKIQKKQQLPLDNKKRPIIRTDNKFNNIPEYIMGSEAMYKDVKSTRGNFNKYYHKNFVIQNIAESWHNAKNPPNFYHKWWLDNILKQGENTKIWKIYDETKDYVVNQLSELIHFIITKEIKLDGTTVYFSSLEEYKNNPTHENIIKLCIEYMKLFQVIGDLGNHVNKSCNNSIKILEDVNKQESLNFICLPLSFTPSIIRFMRYFTAPIYPFLCATRITHNINEFLDPCGNTHHDLHIHTQYFKNIYSDNLTKTKNFYTKANQIITNLTNLKENQLNGFEKDDIITKDDIINVMFLIIHEYGEIYTSMRFNDFYETLDKFAGRIPMILMDNNYKPIYVNNLLTNRYNKDWIQRLEEFNKFVVANHGESRISFTPVEKDTIKEPIPNNKLTKIFSKIGEIISQV